MLNLPVRAPGVTNEGPDVTKDRIALTHKNRLLNAFGSASRKRIDPYLERVELRLGDVVCEAGGILNYAYFPDGV